MGQIQNAALIDQAGIFVSEDFHCATVEMLTRVHSPNYIKFIYNLSKEVAEDGQTIPFTPHVQKDLHASMDKGSGDASSDEGDDTDYHDTSFSVGTLKAARRGVGAVCHAVDSVISGKFRNAFCCIRPPGHHAGVNGLLRDCSTCGFCIFNNVAAGAKHALANEEVKRVAIVDLDVHHGNGTEEIVRSHDDPQSLFFFSIHLFDTSTSYEFYPGTGACDDLHFNIVNTPLAPLWRRQGKGKIGDPNICKAMYKSGREHFRDLISARLEPSLRAFDPDLIMISAGFDGTAEDVGNCQAGGSTRSGSGLDLQPSDYFWATSRIVAVANVCCDGRVVSVLEGGYGKRQKHELDRSDMSKCAAAHVAALVGGSNGDILYDSDNSCEEDLLPSSSKSDFAAEPDGSYAHPSGDWD